MLIFMHIQNEKKVKEVLTLMHSCKLMQSEKGRMMRRV